MRLSQIIQETKVIQVRGSTNISINDLVADSRRVTLGSLFVAIPGHAKDGRDFVRSAVQQGATAVMFEGDFFDALDVVQIRVAHARTALASCSDSFFDHPTHKLYLAGITGTNGKTTLTYLVEAFWNRDIRKSGVLGTINIRYGEVIVESGQTTPESRDLQEHFSEMAKLGVGWASMEVSSHALSQHRVDQCQFDACVFTNLTQDHLDYHSSLENYYQTKELLFTQLLKSSSKKNKLAIVCAEDSYGEKLLSKLKKEDFNVFGYGFDKRHSIHPIEYKLGVAGIWARLQMGEHQLEFVSPLMGRFNLLNIMAAIAIARHSGVNDELIVETLATFGGAPGRLERIPDQGGRILFVDYAHSPDALINVLEMIREWAPKKVISVFGCGGDRDKTKRPIMGFEAAKYSDVCIVTSDNPRTEEADKIIADILPGVKKAGKKEFDGDLGYLVISDRSQAIHRAVALAGRDDVVLVAGKGHEDYQIVGRTKLPFSDQQALRKALEE